MIKKIHYQKLRHGELIHFFNTLSDICHQHAPHDAQMSRAIDAFGNAVTRFASSYRPRSGSESSAAMASFDKLRGSYLIGIRQYVQAHTHHFDKQMVEAAALLLHNIDHFGHRIYLQNYHTESVIISTMVARWENEPNLKAAINQLGLASWVDELKRVNEAFSHSFLKRLGEATPADVPTTAQCRLEALEQYRQLMRMTEAYVVVNPNGSYEHLMREINVLINQVNLMAKGRKRGLREPQPPL